MIRPIKKVALLGADGKLGPSILRELVDSGFHVTILKRKSSKSPSNYPPGVAESRVDDFFEVEGLKIALQGQDAVIVATPGSLGDLQKRLAEAAVAAGVQHFIPADFGSCDSKLALAMEWVPLYAEKTKVREFLKGLAEQHSDFAWTSLVCGHFFDWSPEFLHIWVKKRQADILDKDGQYFSASTLSQVAKATTAVLKKASHADVRNRVLYIQSFSTTQLNVLHAFQDAVARRGPPGESTQQWTINRFNAEKFVKEHRAKMAQGDNEATEEVVWALGTLYADWSWQEDFANERLGLQGEDLHDVVERVVSEQLEEGKH